MCLSPPPSRALLWCSLRSPFFLALSGFSPPQALRWRGGPPALFLPLSWCSKRLLAPRFARRSVATNSDGSSLGRFFPLFSPSLLAWVGKARTFLFFASHKSFVLRAFPPFWPAGPGGGGGEAGLPFFFGATFRSLSLSLYFSLYWSLSENKKRGVSPLFNLPKKNPLRKEVKFFKIAVFIFLNSPLLKPPLPLSLQALDFYT